MNSLDLEVRYRVPLAGPELEEHWQKEREKSVASKSERSAHITQLRELTTYYPGYADF